MGFSSWLPKGELDEGLCTVGANLKRIEMRVN
jgi:hypothetical protein